MIVLDTNVVSELMKEAPNKEVRAWGAAHGNVAISAVTVAELHIGVRNLPHGARREHLSLAVREFLQLHRGRVLGFDEAAGTILAEMWESRRAAGRPLELYDGMIAAIAKVAGAAVATRNTADFEGLGLELIDPWND